MSRPYRIIVWGPGGVGSACLREILRMPELELVAVLAYNPNKHGRDVGELLGLPPVGVKVTTDKEAIFKLDADCVLHTTLPPFDPEAMHRDVIRLLESGKNVVSSAAYHYPHSHGPAYVERLEAACRRGQASIHGTGENPGFMLERLGTTLTGLCNRVDSVRLQEYLDVSPEGSPVMMQALGFGSAPNAIPKGGPLHDLWKEYYHVETLGMMSVSLFGRPLDRVEWKTEHGLSEREIDLGFMTIPRGTVGSICHTFTGYLDDEPKLVTQVFWYLEPENYPLAGAKKMNHWIIEIEGQPSSLRMELDVMASLQNGGMTYHPGDPTSPLMYTTAVNLLQAVPVVCSAEPGIVYPSVFASCTSDLRSLGHRRSIVA